MRLKETRQTKNFSPYQLTQSTTRKHKNPICPQYFLYGTSLKTQDNTDVDMEICLLTIAKRRLGYLEVFPAMIAVTFREMNSSDSSS